MQPYGTWEFAEVYGLMAVTPEQQSGAYDTFVAAVSSQLDAALPERKLEDWLASTAGDMGRKHVPARVYGQGDAALENALRAKLGKRSLGANLDFGETGPAHADFEHLLAYGYMPSHGKDYIPGAFVGPQWKPLLETAANGADRDNWLTWYHLGLVTMAEEINDYMIKNTSASGAIATPAALAALQRAAGLCANGPVLYALAVALDGAGRYEEAAACAVKCCRLFGGDLSVAKDTLRLMLGMGAYEPMLPLYDSLPAGVQADGRIEYLKVSALVHLGRCDEALAILRRPGYTMADFREGEQSVNVLWQEIVRRTGRTDLTLPGHLNFNAGG
jgi:tetratricopeptide (TPR) repeat protein